MFKLKNAISPVIAVILLLAITVVISMGMYSFLEDYTQSTTNSLSSNSIQGDVEIKHIFSNNLYLQSENGINLSLLRITDISGNEQCSLSGETEIDSTGLVGHWTFNEIINQSGTLIIEDISGNGNNLTLFDYNTSNNDGNTTAQLVASGNGYALKFDGVDDYVTILNNGDSLNFQNSPQYSILIGIQINELVYGNTYLDRQYVLTLGNIINLYYQNADEILFNFANRNQSGSWFGGWSAPSSLSSKVNELRTSVLYSQDIYFRSRNNSNFIYGKNGEIVKFDSSLNSNLFLPNSNYILGSDDGTKVFFNGEIDELRIYNRTLLDSEFESFYWSLIKNQQRGIKSIGLNGCNLQKNKQYKVTVIANGNKIESTQFIN